MHMLPHFGAPSMLVVICQYLYVCESRCLCLFLYVGVYAGACLYGCVRECLCQGVCPCARVSRDCPSVYCLCVLVGFRRG